MRRLSSALSISLTVLLVAVPWPSGSSSALGQRFQQTALAAPQPTRTPPFGGGVTHQLKYYFSFGTQEGDVQKPTKFLLEINPATLKKYSVTAKGARYTTPNPSFRVRLDCQK